MFADYRLLRPTVVFSVPRLFDVVLGMFHDRLAAVGGAEAAPSARAALLDEFRDDGPLGDRICSLSVGSAPPSAALLDFLHEVRPFAMLYILIYK